MLPFFYKEDVNPADPIITLEEDGSKHIIQVLRMKNGEQLRLTDGKGNVFTVGIVDDNRKRCGVKIISSVQVPGPKKQVSIGISLIKNNSRFEWFLEKATELGVSNIIPLICDRTEKQHFRRDRLNSILISAMLQSQQAWLPNLSEAVSFDTIINSAEQQQKLIAHCEEGKDKQQLSSVERSNSSVILIGPEGDFSHDEISSAINKGFMPVSLGDTRLRTETAGVAAACLLCLV